MPKLSILLPSHNRCDTLELALESLFAQSFTEWEVLVVGDGCTDGSAAMVGTLARRDKRVRWFDQAKGPGFGYANRNVALRQARGELIGFMADDDLVTPDHIARLVAMFDDDSVQLGVTGSLWVDADGQMVPAVGSLADERYLESFLAGENRHPATSFMHRRAAFDELGYWDDSMPRCADLDMWQRIIRQWGEQSVRTDPRCSCIHFRAPWKRKGTDPDPHEFVIWQELITDGRMGEDLRIAAISGEKLQHSMWRRLVHDRQSAGRVERAASRALESLAFACMQSVSELHRELGDCLCRVEQSTETDCQVVIDELHAERERADRWKSKQRQQIERADRWKERAERYRAELDALKNR